MRQRLHDLARRIQYKHSHANLKMIALLVSVFLFGVIYTGSLLHQRSIVFDYGSSATCVGKLTLLPSLQPQSGSHGISVTYSDVAGIGKFPLVSSHMCFVATKEPVKGKLTTQTALFGLHGIHTSYAITIPEAPKVDTSLLQQPIASALPIQLSLSKPDKLFSYELRYREKTADCTAKQRRLMCDLPALGLKQDQVYRISIERSYRRTSKTLAQTTVTTLPAVEVEKSPVRAGSTIYAKPRSFTFTVNKSLRAASLQLKDAKGKKVPISVTVQDKTVVLSLAKELARETSYTLVFSTAQATDGSTLEAPKVIPFKMSGGPTVKSISIGAYNVASSATITVQFDQPIKQSVDVSKYVSLKGGSYNVSRSSSAVRLQLNNIGRCKSFSIAVKAGMLSTYDIPATKQWSYQSRTTCGVASVYGQSVQKRSLIAHYFGTSGPVTMYVGAIHGNESSSSGLMKSWIDYLEAHPSLYTSRRIVVVPTINPDGIVAGTRTNSRGVNLNRNFPTDNWVKDINDTDGKHKGGGGTKPLSEPEASALATLTISLHPRLLLSFHAQGSLVVGDVGSSSATYAGLYARTVGYRNATGNSSSTFDYSITGAYEDWTYRNKGIPSMVIELSNYHSYNFSHHQSALQKMLN